MNLSLSAVKLILGRSAKAVLTFFAIAAFARLLGASGLGLFFLFEAAVALLTVPGNPGINIALKKHLSENEPITAVLPSALALAFLPVGGVLLALVVFRGPLQAYFGAPIVGLVAIGFVARVASQFSFATLEGLLRVGEIGELFVGRTLLWVVGGGIWIVFGGGVTELIIVRIASDWLIVVWSVLKVSSTGISLGEFRVDRGVSRSLFDYAKYSSVATIGGAMYGWMDVAVLGLFVTQDAIGAYEVAWRISLLPFLVGSSIARTLFPQISIWDAEGAHNRIEALLPQAILPSALVTIPAFVGTLVLADPILRYLFGPEFTVAAAVLAVLLGEKIIQSFRSLFDHALQAIDRPDAAAKANLITIGTNIVLNFALIPVWGILGAAVATAVSFGLNSILYGFYLSQSVRIRVPWKGIGWATIAAVIMGLTLYTGIQIQPVTSLPILLAAISFGGGVYLIIIIINTSLRNTFIQQFQKLLS